jgi:hypothetical protein
MREMPNDVRMAAGAPTYFDRRGKADIPIGLGVFRDPVCGSAWKKDPGSGVIGVEKWL